MKLLLVEDDRSLRRQLRWALEGTFPEIREAEDEEGARREAAAMDRGVVLLDLHLPPQPENPEAGLRLLAELARRPDDLTVVVLSGTGDPVAPKEALRTGAWDFLAKPVDTDFLLAVLRRAAERVRLLGRLERRGPGLRLFHGMAGESRAMEALFEWCRRAAPSDLPVLLEGESGSGKERAAAAIHELSGRAKGPFVAVNCGAIPENLFESEFFGYVKGAFTGAAGAREGLLKRSHGGTLFLDEITLLTPASQGKLLRFLEDGRFRPLGSSRDETVDVRIVSATNAEVDREVREGRFRADLFFRLAALRRKIPPLRERREDIPLLLSLFLGPDPPPFTKEALARLESYHWPGNVRQLQHVARRVAVMVRNRPVTPEDLEMEGPYLPAPGGEAALGPFEERVARFERSLLEAALAHASGDRRKAAEALSLSPSQFRYLAKKYGL